MAASETVDLGFLNDETDCRLLESRYFPSKVGGKPAWLSLKPIPSSDSLSCAKCGDPLSFLMQVYSPRDKPEDDAFHRTIYLFVCRKPSCNSANDGGNFVAFRSQLPRVNQFFSFEPPPDDPSDEAGEKPTASKYQPLCVVCGCIGSKTCSKCHTVNYCGKDHQTRHWKSGHKKSCGKTTSQVSDDCGVLFKEFELEIEEEDNTNPDKSMSDETAALQDYQQLTADPSILAANSQFSEQDLEGLATQENEDDKIFKKFQKRTAANKDQVLRYHKGGEPLWVSSQHQAKPENIPACSCGAPRQFEFQVMPQLLNFLDVDEMEGNSLDWGTLCIYTCLNSCHVGNNYVTEFIWKQDFTVDR